MRGAADDDERLVAAVRARVCATTVCLPHHRDPARGVRAAGQGPRGLSGRSDPHPRRPGHNPAVAGSADGRGPGADRSGEGARGWDRLRMTDRIAGSTRRHGLKHRAVARHRRDRTRPPQPRGDPKRPDGQGRRHGEPTEQAPFDAIIVTAALPRVTRSATSCLLASFGSTDGTGTPEGVEDLMGAAARGADYSPGLVRWRRRASRSASTTSP
jgi:hypothetical protein